MPFNESIFCFDMSALGLDEREDFIAHIPRSLTSRLALFAALRQSLGLPDYFGENWDALSECLRDLSWIEQRRVVLLHEDLPPIKGDILAMYLDVLSECITDWKPDEAHELVAVFPENTRHAIHTILDGK